MYGFHAQQACEKLLKALIAAHGQSYPLTHNLEKLLEIAANLQEVLPMLPYDLLDLEPFAVELRYEFGGELADDDRTAIRESVTLVRDHIIARILQLEQTP